MRQAKRTITALAVLLTLLIAVFAGTACNRLLSSDAAEKYEVSYYEGETLLKTLKLADGDLAGRAFKPEKTGHDFAGWYADAACTVPYADTPLSGNAVLYAKFERRNCIVSFYAKDGVTRLKIQNVPYGDPAEAPDAPSVEGFVFDGWDRDFSSVTGDMLITALYKEIGEETPESVTVSFSVPGTGIVHSATLSPGDDLAECVMEANEKIVVPAGFSFDGNWFTDEALTFPAPGRAGTEDLVLYAGVGFDPFAGVESVKISLPPDTTADFNHISFVLSAPDNVPGGENVSVSFAWEYLDGGEWRAVADNDGDDGTLSVSGDVIKSSGEHSFRLTVSASAEGYGTRSMTSDPVVLTVTDGTLPEGVFSATGVTAVYDGIARAITVSGTLPGDEVSYSADPSKERVYSDENPSFRDAGTYTVRYRVKRPNYVEATGHAVITITRRPVSITLTRDPDAVAYGDPALPEEYLNSLASVEGVPDGETLSFSVSCDYGREGYRDVKEDGYPVTITVNGDYPNYEISAGGGTLSIHRATLTGTPSHAALTYGDPVPTDGFSMSFDGFGWTDTETVISGTPEYSTTYTQGSSAGSCTITAAAGSLSATNYDFAFAEGVLEVLRKPVSITLTKNPDAVTYGDPAPSGEALNALASVKGAIEGNPVNCSVSCGYEQGSPVKEGGYPVTITVDGDYPDYDISVSGGTLVVNRKPVVITPGSVSVTYGDPAPDTFPVSFTSGGYAFNPEASGLKDIVYSPVCEYGTEGHRGVVINEDGSVGGYDITVGPETEGRTLEEENPDYLIETGTGTLTVNRRKITITAASAGITYGDPAPVYAATLSDTADGTPFNPEESGLSAVSYTLSCDYGMDGHVDAGTYKISIVAGSNPDYTIKSVSGNLAVSPKEVPSPVIEIAGDSHVYTGGALEPAVTVKDGETEIPSSEYTVSYLDNTNAGLATVSVTDRDGGNYTVSGTATFTIAKADSIVSSAPSAIALTYDGSARNLVTAGTCSGGTMNYALGTNDTSAPEEGWGANIPQGTVANTYYVWHRVIGDANHNNVAPVCVTAKITKASNSFTTSPSGASSLVYNGSERALIANAGTAAFGTPEFSLEPESGWISAEQIKAVNAGSYTVHYRVEGTDNYDGLSGSFAVTISPKTVTPSIEMAETSFVYTGSAITPDVTVKDGETTINSSEYTINYLNNTNAGTATVTVTDNEGGNYKVSGTATFTIKKAASSVTTAPSANTLAYNGSAQNLVTAGECSGGTMNYALGADGTTAPDEGWGADIPQGMDAKTYHVWYRVTGDANHNDVAPVCVTSTITKAENSLSVSPSGVSSLVYNGNEQALIADAGSALFGTPEFSLEPESGWVVAEQIKGKDAGDYTVHYRVEGTDNYTGLSGSFAVTIGKAAVTVKAKDRSTVYGEPEYTDGFGYEITAGSFFNGDTFTCAYDTTYTAGDGISTDTVSYSISLTPEDNPNYDVTTQNGVLSVLRREITIAITNPDAILYGDDVPSALAGEKTADGATIGETTESVAYTLACDYTPGSGVGTYTISAVLTDNDTNKNYVLSEEQTTGTLSVSRRPVSIAITNPDAIRYGDEMPAALVGKKTVDGATIDGAAESVAYTLACDYTPGSGAGTYTISAVLTDNDTNKNYVLSEEQATGTLSVSKRPVSIRAKDRSTAYGEPEYTDGFGYEVKEGSVYGEDVLACAYDTDYTAGNGISTDTVTYSIFLTAGDNPNYDVTTQNGVLTVLTRGILIKVSDSVTHTDATEAWTNDDWTGLLTLPEDSGCTGTALFAGDVLSGTLRTNTGAENTYTSGENNTVGDFVWDDTDPLAIMRGSEDISGNYDVLYSLRVKIIVSEFTYTAKDIDLTYDGNPHVFRVTDIALTDPVVEYSVDNQTDWSTDAPSFTDVCSHTVWFKIHDASNEHERTDSRTVKIGPKDVSAIEIAGDSHVYTGDPITPAVTVKDGETAIPSSEYTVSYSDNTDAGTATVTVTDVEGGNYTISGTATFTIAKADSIVSPAPAAIALTYDGSAQNLVTAGTCSGGTMNYVLGTNGTTASEEGWSVDIPQGTDANTYYVWYRVIGDANHNDVAPVCVTAKITKASNSFTTPPSGALSLVYDGNEQALIANAGTAAFGTPEFSLEPDSGWGSAEQIKAVNAGDYTVHYRVEGADNYDGLSGNFAVTIAPRTVSEPIIEIAGDTFVYTGSAITPDVTVKDGETTINSSEYTINYLNNTNAGTATVSVKDNEGGNYKVSGTATFTIKKAASSVTTTPSANTLAYNGNAQNLVTGGECSGGTMNYTLGADGMTAPGEGWGADIPQGTNAKTYHVWYRVSGDANHNDTVPVCVIAKITKAANSFTTSPSGASSLEYNGSEQALIADAGSATFGTPEFSLAPESAWVSAEQIKGKDVGSYTVHYRVEGTDNYDGLSGSFAVTIASRTVSEPVIEIAGDSHVYTGSAITPDVTVKDGETAIPSSEYTVSYSNNTNAGTATVTVTDKDGGNYTVNGTATFEIAKAPSNVTTAPSANTLTYDGGAHNLVTAGACSGGTMNYVLGADGTSAPGEGWGADIPQGTDAKAYYVWYKVSGDANHGDTDPVCVTATIKQAANSFTTQPSGVASLVYNGNEQALIANAGSATFGTPEFSLAEDSGWASAEQIKGKDARSYTVHYRVKGTDNYDGLGGSVSVTIGKASVKIKAKDRSIVYGEPGYTSGFGYEVTEGSVFDGDVLACTYKTNYTAGDGISTETDTYAITVTPEDPNYDITAQSGVLTVSKRPVVIRINRTAVTENQSTAWTNGSWDNCVFLKDNSGCTGSVLFERDVLGGTLATTDMSGAGAGSFGLYAVPAGSTGLSGTFTPEGGSAISGNPFVWMTDLFITRDGGDVSDNYAVAYDISVRIIDFKSCFTPSLNPSEGFSYAESTGTFSGTYDGKGHKFSVLKDESYPNDVTVTYALNGGSPSETAPVLKDSGNYSVACHMTDRTDDGISCDITYTVKIDKAVLTGTPSHDALTYGDPVPTDGFSMSYAGFKGSDTEAAVTGSPEYSTNYTQGSNAGSYNITATAGTLSATNYAISLTTGTLTVSPKPVAITLSGVDGTYTYNQTDQGSSIKATYPLYDGGTGNAAVTFSGKGTSFINAGTYTVMAKITDTNYTASAVTATVVMNKANVIIGGSLIQEHNCDGTAHAYVSTDLTAMFTKPDNSTENVAAASGAVWTFKDGNDNAFAAKEDAGTYGVKIVFESDNYKGEGKGYLKVKGVDVAETLYTVEDALNTASSGNVIVKHNTSFASGFDCCYSGNSYYTVKSGVTLLVPYSDTDTKGWVGPGESGSANYNAHPQSNGIPVLFRKLTVPSGVNLTVNGTLIVGAMTGKKDAGGHQNKISGNYTQIDCNGTIIAAGGTVRVMGYIKGSGALTTSGNATIIENLYLSGWMGGTKSTARYAGDGTSVSVLSAGDLNIKNPNMFPFSQYELRSVQIATTVNYGSKLQGYTKIATAQLYKKVLFVEINIPAQVNEAYLTFVSSSTTAKDGLLRLSSGASVVKTFSSDRVGLVLHGAVSDGFTSITMKVLKKNCTMSSEKVFFPVDGRTDIVLAEGATLTQNYKFKLMPGATITVNPGATYTMNGSLFVYTSDFKDIEEFPYPGEARGDAFLRIKGTMNINGSFGGKLYGDIAAQGTVTTGTEAKLTGIKSINGTGEYEISVPNVIFHFTEVESKTKSAELVNSNAAIVTPTSGKTYKYVNGAWVQQ